MKSTNDYSSMPVTLLGLKLQISSVYNGLTLVAIQDIFGHILIFES